MDDLISRKAVLDALGEPHPMDYNACATVHIVKSIPSVDAVPVKHGRWIMMGGMKPPEYHHHHQCSVCESYAPMRMPYGTKEALTPWCPGCGAKMDLEETP